MAKHIVGLASELPPGNRRVVTIRGRPILILNHKGEYFALLDRCPHQSASLCGGLLTRQVSSPAPGRYVVDDDKAFLRCPWHGWEYDIRTGESWFDPVHNKVRSYTADVEAGSEIVKGPYVAETFSVSIDQDYLVVEV